jgi:hypothetical protein
MLIEVVMLIVVMLTLIVVVTMAVAGSVWVVSGAARLVPCPSCHHPARTVPPGAHACLHCHYQRLLHSIHRTHGDGQGVATS